MHGRNDLLDALRNTLDATAPRVEVLAGMGGCGKTTVALALAEIASHRGYLTWWVDAGDELMLRDGMLTIAAEVGATAAAVDRALGSAAEAIELCWRLLGSFAGPRWLLVFDGADDVSVLAPAGASLAGGTGWVRSCRTGLTVVTSRLAVESVWGDGPSVHDVGTLDAADGAKIVLDRMPGAGAGRVGPGQGSE